MQMHKFFTTIALVMLGNMATMQATPKQQRHYMDALSASTPESSEFTELTSAMSESPAKVQRLLKAHTSVSAMAANSMAWQKANKSTLSGKANNTTMQATNQLKKEQNALYGKIKKIRDSHNLIQKNIEQAYKILEDNRAERENRLTAAFSEINQSMIPMSKLTQARKKEAQSNAPASEHKKPAKSKTKNDKQNSKAKSSEKNKKSSSKKNKSEKKVAKSKKDKKSKKDLSQENEEVEVRYW